TRCSFATAAPTSTGRSPRPTSRHCEACSSRRAGLASGTCRADMDLSFTAEEEAFAAEIREWLRANLGPPSDDLEWGRRWQAKLAADRWVGIHWPAAYGGRSATPVQVALYNIEYARSRAPQPVNRVGINLAGPTLLAHGTDEQKARWLPRILDAS